jgi:hypothetical protein
MGRTGWNAAKIKRISLSTGPKPHNSKALVPLGFPAPG